MGVQSVPSPRESVIIVMDANSNKGNVNALDWALKHVVRPRDRVVVLGVLREFGKKTSCFPLSIGVSISGIWEKLEFSGQGEVKPREVEEEIEKKKEQYQSALHPFYRQCKKNEVKFEVKLAAGYCPMKITVEEAQKANPRWIVLDCQLKKHKATIYERVGCNLAVMKEKDVATLMPSRVPLVENSPANYNRTDESMIAANQTENLPNECLRTLDEGQSSTLAPSQSPFWYPLAWRNGYPRAFSHSELEVITNGFAHENIVKDEDNIIVYKGFWQETPVSVRGFLENDERFWSMLRILSRTRHRNIMNLIGYCCTGTTVFILYDYPYMGTLEMNLKCDDKARNLSWKARWYIALEIGGSLRYLHEECVDGVIVHLSVCSSNVICSHGFSAMLSNFTTARWLKYNVASDDDEDSPDECTNVEEEECLSIDVHDYGMFLIELISGKSGEGQSLINWAIPLLENGSLSEVMDSRLMDSDDTGVVHHMARAALVCLKNNSGHRFSVSESPTRLVELLQVLAMVRGDQLAVPKC